MLGHDQTKVGNLDNAIRIPEYIAANPGELLSAPAISMDRSQAEALMIDLCRATTPTEGGFCTYQPSFTAAPAQEPPLR